MIEEHMPPGTSEVKHHHSHARQFFFVIRGELRLEVEGREYKLRPGDGLEIHPGQKHQAIGDPHAGCEPTAQPRRPGTQLLESALEHVVSRHRDGAPAKYLPRRCPRARVERLRFAG